MNFQDPTWSINALLRISTTTIKLECTKGGGGWGVLFWPKTLGYLWSIFAKHIYSTVWLTLDDIPEILSFQTVYDMTITLNCMLPKIDQACWGKGWCNKNLPAGGIWWCELWILKWYGMFPASRVSHSAGTFATISLTCCHYSNCLNSS